jgi:hypothetical protein
MNKVRPYDPTYYLLIITQVCQKFYYMAVRTGVYFITKQCLDTENGVSRLLQDVSNYLPINTATYARTPETSRAPIFVPPTSQVFSYFRFSFRRNM